MTLAERDCRNAGEGVRRENIRRDLRDRQRVALDDEDTRGRVCTETSVRLRTGGI